MRPTLPLLPAVLILALACASGPANLPDAPEPPGEPEAEPERQRPARPARPDRNPGRDRPGTQPDAPDDAPADGEPAAPAPAPPAGPAPAPGARPAPAPGPRPAPAAPSGIRQLGADTWEVSRARADSWQEDPSRLGNATQEGRGWRLRQLKDKDAWHLGLRNGDIVTEVNGYTLGSTPELMLAFAQLQGASDLSVKFTREGRAMQHRYQIR